MWVNKTVWRWYAVIKTNIHKQTKILRIIILHVCNVFSHRPLIFREYLWANTSVSLKTLKLYLENETIRSLFALTPLLFPAVWNKRLYRHVASYFASAVQICQFYEDHALEHIHLQFRHQLKCRLQCSC